jgi:hypothetical protein
LKEKTTLKAVTKKKSQNKINDSLNAKSQPFIVPAVFIFLSFLITTRFLAKDIVPNNTDLGHHIYWSRMITEKESLPEYNTGGEVVVGEHIVFAALSKITGVSLLSFFPVFVLSLANFLSFMAVYCLSLRIFKSQKSAWAAFFILGVLYAIPEPFGKFVSGGVVGNVWGNFLIPLVLLSLLLAHSKKSAGFLAAGIFLSFGLAFIHHLSTLVLILVITGTLLVQLFFSFLDRRPFFTPWRKLLLNPLPLIMLVLAVIFVFGVYIPDYLGKEVVAGVAQAPIKDTHQGVSLKSFILSLGEWRVLLGVSGLGLFIFRKKRKKQYADFPTALALGGIGILGVLCFFPELIKIDLPSRRVVNYLAAPLAAFAGYFVVFSFNQFRSKLSPQVFTVISAVFLTALTLNGLGSSLKNFQADYHFPETVQVYRASEYLASRTTKDDLILKDHTNLAADTWIKFFFLRGYDYLLSRTFDYKYEQSRSREQCTFLMATVPESTEGKNCFSQTGVRFLFLKNGVDNFFFNASPNFSRIYESPEAVIYYKNN